MAVEDIPTNGATIDVRQQDHQIDGGEGWQLLFIKARSLITMRGPVEQRGPGGIGLCTTRSDGVTSCVSVRPKHCVTATS